MYVNNYVCKDFLEPKKIQFGQKHQEKTRRHTKVWHEMVVQIVSKSKSTHDWGKIKSTYDWFQNTSTHEVWYQ